MGRISEEGKPKDRDSQPRRHQMRRSTFAETRTAAATRLSFVRTDAAFGVALLLVVFSASDAQSRRSRSSINVHSTSPHDGNSENNLEHEGTVRTSGIFDYRKTQQIGDGEFDNVDVNAGNSIPEGFGNNLQEEQFEFSYSMFVDFDEEVPDVESAVSTVRDDTLSSLGSYLSSTTGIEEGLNLDFDGQTVIGKLTCTNST